MWKWITKLFKKDDDMLDAYVDRVIEREGGFSDHPADSGGETMWGVTIGTLKAWRGDRNISEEDVRRLTLEEARKIYVELYWKPSRADKLPEKVKDCHFDTAINCGVETAAKLLQKSLVALGHNVIVDGVIGKRTIAACFLCNDADLVEEYLSQREKYYIRISTRNPKLKVFLQGWLNRLDKIRRVL